MSTKRHSGDEKTFLRHYPSTPHLDTFRGNTNLKNNNKSTVLLNAAASNVNLQSPSYMPKTTLSTFASHKSGTDLRYRDDPNPYKVSDIDEYRIKVHDPFVPKNLHRSTQHLTFYTDNSDLPYVIDDDLPDENEINGRPRMFDKYDSSGSNEYYGGRIHRSQTMKSCSNSHKSVSVSTRSHHTGRSSRISGSVSNSSTGEGDIDGECEIPEPDYDGSQAGSSEDIPLPLPDSSCSEEYSSVSAASDPDHYALGESGQSPSPETTAFIQADRTGADSGLDTPTKITSQDIIRIEYALKGRKTTVFVSDSLANLYVMKKTSVSPTKSQTAESTDDWVLKYTGVPVLLLDSGETKSRDKRRIQIVLAELGSGLALWKDVIDNLSSYKVMEGSLTFHTMHLSSDHTKIIGLSFDDEESAIHFSERVDKLTSDFANISLSGSKTKSKNKKDKANVKASKSVKFVRPKKSEISQPCCFHHISSLSSSDRSRLSTLQNFIVNSDTDNDTSSLHNRSTSFNGALSSMSLNSRTSLSTPKSSIPVTSSGSEISF